MRRKTSFAILIAFAVVVVVTSVTLAFVLPDRMVATGDVLTRLRALMVATNVNVKAYIVPSADAHQSEYLAARDRRRAFLTGFTGSAGTAVVTAEKALIWTDGRYYQQASQQLDENWELMKDGLPDTPTIAQWLSKNCQDGDRIGVDASLYSATQWNTLVSAFENEGCVMTSIKPNLVDEVWDEQPDQPNNAINPLDIKFAGKSIADKLVDIRAKMSDQSAKVMVVSALDEIACKLAVC